MPIVQNFTSFSTPDVFLREAEPAASIRGNGIGTVGVIVQATRGPVNESIAVSDLSDYIRKFGAYDKNIAKSFMFVYNLFKQGANSVKVVRVTDGTETAASGQAGNTTFQVTTPGTWGNGVKLTVTLNPVTGYVDLTFSYGTAETFIYEQVQFTDPTGERYYKTIIEQSPDDFVNVAVEGTTNPTAAVITFSGGSNGTDFGDALNDTDYVGTNGAGGRTGLAVFEADDSINFLCTDRCSDTVNAALRDQAASPAVSPRIAIIAPALGTTVAQLKTAMTAYNNDQVVMTYPYLQIVNPYTNKKEYHAPTAFYAGLLSTLSYEQSPSRRQVLGVIGTERALSRAEVDELSANRVSPITLLAGQGFVVRNGYNTSSNPARQNITRRRAANFFAKAFEGGAQQFVSRPHTVALRNDVVSAFGSLCENELKLGRIGNVNGGKAYAIKCDAQNNPDAVVRANRLLVDVQISLLAPADFILVTLDTSEAKVITLQ